MTREELLKTAKPILFNTEMVQAILEGRKTVTRRVINRDISNQFDCESDGTPIAYMCTDTGDSYEPYEMCRYKPGDILYIRETWFRDIERYMYKANYSENEKFYRDGEEIRMKWKPSIHMPKEAARIFLRVTDVRVERLQDITEEQARREGISHGSLFGGDIFEIKALSRFPRLWNSTIKKKDLVRYGWYANSYVWVIEFERIEVE